MFEGEDIAFNGLEVCSYRHLQGMAKKMSLPSNVKKVYLIEMIRAKKYCTETDLKAIVDRVKMERKVNAQAKKKKLKRKTFRLQGAEISSTSNSQSPPITLTPKRPSDFVIQYSPDITQTIMKYQPKSNVLQTGTSILQPMKRHIESDRVLRSFNSVKRPNYRIMEQNDYLLGVINAQSTVQEIREDRVQEIRQEKAYQSINVTIQKQRPIVSTSMLLNQDRQLVPVVRNLNVSKPAKRQRKLSGIYSLQPLEKPIYEYVPTVGYRRTDGRVTKINAVIQKPLSSTLLPKNHAFLSKNRAITAKNRALAAKNPALIPKERTLTVQDMINYKVDHPDINKNAIETSTLYEIEYQTNEIDRQIFSDHQSNEERVESKNYQDVETFSHISQNATEPIYSMSGIRNTEMNPSRKVYKGCQRKTTRKNGWNYSVEYQEHENTDARKEWNIYDVNGQLLDKTDKELTSNTNHSNKATTETNCRVKQTRFAEPISRDYQVEYQRFNQEMTDRDVENAKFEKQGVTHARTNKENWEITHRTHTRSEKEQWVNQADGNITNSRSDQRLNQLTSRNIDLNRPEMTDKEYWASQEMTDKTDINANSQYPNMSSLADVIPNDDYSQEPIEVRENSNFSVYYHKKIRADHVKTQKVRESERLPRINDAFTQFNDVQYRSLTQPLYVQVSAESERVPPIPRPGNNVNNTCMLESIYNFKNQFITNLPVLMIATTQTHCTYSTKTVTTAIVQPAAADYCNTSNPYERASLYQQTDCVPRLYDYLKPEYRPKTDFGCDEVLSSSTNSLETTNSQELGANVTIPEMVEDALELISQDGDYMERIGMDVRVQCILCDWAGPKIILEYHVKKEHSNEIQHQNSNEWSIILSLGELVTRQTWCSQFIQYEDNVYVLNAKYVHTDVILVSLSIIPTESEMTKRGRITVYNKISGQPYIYEDDIKHIPDSMPYEYGLKCLTLDIGKLDLMPNLRLVNREWERSPDLNNVEVIVYVKLLD